MHRFPSALRSTCRRLRRLFAALLAAAAALSLDAQTDRREPYISWEEFVTEYFGDEPEGQSAGMALEHLEELRASPLNLNTARRADLLALPFLDEAQADSILAYRARRRAFMSLGELQLVHGLDRTRRRWISLFVVAGDTAARRTGWRERLLRGRHEIVTRLDVPLYRRAGQRSFSPQELAESPNQAYWGNALAHTLRYRYRWRDDVAYGLTLQKDAGEPFLAEGNYPYDYVSFFFSWRAASGRWRLLAGDFNVNLAQGLLFGSGFFDSRTAAVESAARRRTSLRPHTSADESDFFRGVAFSFRPARRWQAAAFVSFRRLDGRREGDTLRSFLTDGLHRTRAELDRRRAVACLTGGAGLTYTAPGWSIGAGGYAAHYSRYVEPEARSYNRFYLRGRMAAGASVHYAWRAGRWSAEGEAALDRRAHPATIHRLRCEAADGLALTLQGRYFSPRYVAPYAQTLQQASRVQNEAGLLAGLHCTRWPRQEWTAYADWCRFPAPTFRADRSSQSVEAFVQGRFATRGPLSFLVRYKCRARQENVSGTDGILQHVWTHRARLQAAWEQPALSLFAAADACAAGSQTRRTEWGWMLSGRAAVRPSDRWRGGAFASLFFTDSYAARLFAYEPQLPYAGAFPSFAYHGFRLAMLARWRACAWLEAGLRAGWTHYFNRDHTGSGPQRIDGPDQADVSLQVQLTL